VNPEDILILVDFDSWIKNIDLLVHSQFYGDVLEPNVYGRQKLTKATANYIIYMPKPI
jgi:hypothetical protein